MRRFIVALAGLVAACSGFSAEKTSKTFTTAGPAGVAPVSLSLTAPAPTPTSLSGSAASGRSAMRILVAGDVIPHRPKLATPLAIGHALAPLSSLFATADAVVANHEASIVDREEFDRYDPIRGGLFATANWTKTLAKSGIAAVTLANNHACDAGLGGLTKSIEAAGNAGLVGIGADDDEPFRARVLSASGGHRVCAVAWTAEVNARTSKCASSGKLAVAPIGKAGEAIIARAVHAARASGGCDAVIAIGHAGDEYAQQTDGGRAQARAAALAGADAVILHHPHVPSGIDVVTADDGRRVPLFLSLGNLVSNQGEAWRPTMAPAAEDRTRVARNAWTRLGMIADLSFDWSAASIPGRPGNAEAARPAVKWGYQLVWTDVEAPLGDAKQGALVARPLDPKADADIIAVLGRDRQAPKRIFDNPCWLSVGKGCR